MIIMNDKNYQNQKMIPKIAIDKFMLFLYDKLGTDKTNELYREFVKETGITF